ncbi:MAG: glycosyltransferase family 2 protein [Candidatus Bathyarchaeota archaeon]
MVNYNGLRWLKRSLPSLFRQNFKDFEVIVVDNASRDGSAEFIEKNYPQVKLVKLDKNYGFAKANNIGLKHANGRYLVFLNNDTEVLEGWLENLVRGIKERPEYKLLASIQLPDQNGNKTRDLMVYFGPSICDPRVKTVWRKKADRDNIIVDSLFASGACFIMPREWLEEVELLFDDYYFMAAEDLDLSLRTIFLGGKIGYVMNSKLIHYTGGSSRKVRTKITRLAMRNELLTAYKLLSLKNFIKILLVKIFYLIARNVIKADEFKINFAMTKGFLDFFANFPRYTEYRLNFA